MERVDAPGHGRIFVVTEGLYSADGDRAALGEIVPIAKAHDATVIVDEAHSFATTGPRGLGVADAQGVYDDIDVVIGTFSKALGATGGFALCSQESRDLFRYFAGSYTSSRGLAPAVAGAALAGTQIMQTEGAQLRQRLQDNVRYTLTALRHNGMDIGHTVSHIVPVMVGDEDRTIALANFLRASGIFGGAFVYPHVPRGGGRLRFGVTATHTRQDLDTLVSVLASARDLGLVGQP